MPISSVAVLLFLNVVCASAQTAQVTVSSDATAISLAQKSVSVLTAGVPISDVTLTANVISIIGSDTETGTAVFQATGPSMSRVKLNLSGGSRTDVRNVTNGLPTGAWINNGEAANNYAQHNTWTDAAWFFPAFSSLALAGNPNVTFKNIGQEQHGGVNSWHIQAFVTQTGPFTGLQHLSALDFYLDPVSYLPLAVAFNVHPDNDLNTDIPVEIRFTSYQKVAGVQVPFHFQKIFNGSVILDVTVTSAAFNTGLQADSLTLQ